METTIKQQIITELEKYLSLHGMSQNDFAEKSGVNAAYVSQLRNGKTSMPAGGGKDVEISDKFYEMIANAIGLSLTKEYWQIVPTEQMQRILLTLEEAKEFGSTNLIIGETGSGKTYIKELFSKQHPLDVVCVTVSSSDNISDLIEKVSEAIKMPTAKTKSKRMRDIIRYFKTLKLDGHRPMLIFDESEYMKQPSLCAMKEFYDGLNNICSVVLIGTDQLTKNIDKLRKRNKDGIPQFYRRIKFGIRELPRIDRSFTAFFAKFNITDKILMRFLCEICDNYGELHDVLVPTMRESERIGQPISEKLIRTILNLPLL